MKKFLAPFFLAIWFTAFSAGCGSGNTTTVGLQVELTGIARTSDGVTKLSWRVVNPNIVPYLVAQSSNKVHLNGVLVGTTNDREPLAVPAQSQVNRTSQLVIAGTAAEQTLAAAAAAGSGAYQVESYILIRLYGDTTDKSNLKAAGTLPVTAK